MSTKNRPHRRIVWIVLLTLATVAAFCVGIPQVIFSIGLAVFVLFFPVFAVAALVCGVLAAAGVGPFGSAARRRREQAQNANPAYFSPAVPSTPPTSFDPRAYRYQGYASNLDTPALPYAGSASQTPIFIEEDRLNLVELDPMTAEARDLDWEAQV